MRRLSFDAFINFDGVIGEDQLSVAAPICSRLPDFSGNDTMSFPDEIFQLQTPDRRGLES